MCTCVRDGYGRACGCTASHAHVRAIARADDAAVVYICIHDACMYLYPCASGYTDERIAGAGPPHTRAHVLRPSARARVSACDWARTHPCRHLRARSVGVDRGWLGSQAFQEAKAFNANIGAWNTASVSNMQSVCAAFSARRRATAGGTRSAGRRCGAGRRAWQDRRCGARVCVCADVWARACGGVHVCRYSCV
jgi:hypothetical protein